MEFRDYSVSSLREINRILLIFMAFSFIAVKSRIKLKPITTMMSVELIQKKVVIPRTMKVAATKIATLQMR